MFFHRRYRIAVWSISLAVASVLLALILLQGVYTPSEPYLIPVSQRVKNAIALGIVVALAPAAAVEFINNRWLSGVDENIPRLLRDVTEAVRSGVPLFTALEDASARDYGPVSKVLEAAMVRFNLTSDLDGSLTWLGENLIRPAARRMSTILIEAYETGGRMMDVLDASVSLFTSLAEYREERYAQMRPYVFVVYMGSFVFMAISWVFLVQFLTPLAAAAATPSVAQSGILQNVLYINYYKSILFWAAVMEAILGGLVAGKMSSGRISAGLIHSTLLLLATLAVFNAFSV